MIGRSQCDARKCWLAWAHSAEQKPNKSLKVFRRQSSEISCWFFLCGEFTVWPQWILPLSLCFPTTKFVFCSDRSAIALFSPVDSESSKFFTQNIITHSTSASAYPFGLTVRRPLVILCESAFQRNNDTKSIRAESEEGVRMTTMTH